jgi:hypothetical protein
MWGPVIDQSSGGDRQVVGLEIEGRMLREAPVPIAAHAILRDAGTGEPVFEFPIAFGLGTIHLGGNGVRQTRETGAGPVTLLETSFVQAWPTFSPDNDHSFLGQLELTPSREIALNTKTFDHYLGTRITMPVAVEILTVQGFASRDAIEPRRGDK